MYKAYITELKKKGEGERMSSVQEETITLPEEVVEASSGLAFDIGGSVAKLAYRSKEDYKNGKPLFKVENNEGKVRLALFAREHVEDIVDFIRERCDLSNAQEGEKNDVYCTGFGSSKWKDMFESQLNVKLNNLLEFDCFTRALTYQASNLPGEKVFHEADPDGVKEAQTMMFAWFQTAMKMMNFTNKGTSASGGPPPGVGGPAPGVGGPPPGVFGPPSGVGGPPPGVGGPPSGVGGPPPGVFGPPPGVGGPPPRMGGPPPGVGGPPPGEGGPPPGVGGPPPGVGGPPPGVGGPPPGAGGPPPGVGGPPPGVGGPPPGVGGPPKVGGAPADGSLFPCLMCVIGSGVTYLKVLEDGSYTMLDGSLSGGRTFLGLAAILTGGVQDFSVLLEMAEKGDRAGVDTYVRDLKAVAGGGEADAYDAMPDDAMLFQYGKASVGDVASFKKEDLVASLFQQFCENYVQLAHLVAISNELRRVYFVGSFVNNQLARKYFTYSAVMRGRKDVGPDKKPCNTHFSFIRHGAYLGAIGAFLSSTPPEDGPTHL